MDKSVEEFQHYIYGVDFPADKEVVASTAEANGELLKTSSGGSETRAGNALTTPNRSSRWCGARCRGAGRGLRSGSWYLL